MKTTGWQEHSVRGFLAGVVRKRLKLKLSSKKVDGNRVGLLAQAAARWALARHRHPESHAARQDRSCTAGPKRTQCRDRALARFDISGLRAHWHSVFRRRPPLSCPVIFCIAWPLTDS
jgi:hypothetical protein